MYESKHQAKLLWTDWLFGNIYKKKNKEKIRNYYGTAFDYIYTYIWWTSYKLCDIFFLHSPFSLSFALRFPLLCDAIFKTMLLLAVESMKRNSRENMFFSHFIIWFDFLHSFFQSIQCKCSICLQLVRYVFELWTTTISADGNHISASLYCCCLHKIIIMEKFVFYIYLIGIHWTVIEGVGFFSFLFFSIP